MADKTFAEGLRFELPSDKAPDFVKGKLSIKIAEFIPFLEKNQSNAGWVNIDLKVGQSGKAYAELNTWKPNEVKPKVEERAIPQTVNGVDYPADDISTEDIPF